MALTPIALQKRAKSGGGGIGSVIGGTLGAIGGAIAGTFVGNPVGGASLGYGAGAAAGGAVGGAIAPGKSAGPGFQAGSTAVARRLEAAAPEPSKVLEESLVALQDTNPDIAKTYGPQLVSAYEQSLAQRKKGQP